MCREAEGNNVLLLVELLKLGRDVALIAVKDNYTIYPLPLYVYILVGQRRRISLPVRGAGYELLIPFGGYSAELKRERNQRSLVC